MHLACLFEASRCCPMHDGRKKPLIDLLQIWDDMSILQLFTQLAAAVPPSSFPIHADKATFYAFLCVLPILLLHLQKFLLLHFWLNCWTGVDWDIFAEFCGPCVWQIQKPCLTFFCCKTLLMWENQFLSVQILILQRVRLTDFPSKDSYISACVAFIVKNIIFMSIINSEELRWNPFQ